MKRFAYLTSSYALGSGLVAVIVGITDPNKFILYLGIVLVISGIANMIAYVKK